MRLLYTLIILLYRLAISAASLFNTKAKRWIEGRKDIFKKLEAAIEKDKPLAWFHCASLGEFEQGRPVIERYKERYPDHKILLTFFSPSGYEIRKNYAGADHVFYLPLDTRANAERFISITDPSIIFFIKYEFWFNYIDVLHKRNVPFYLVSANFRKSQHFFKWYGGWQRKMLHYYRHIFVQTDNSKRLLNDIGVKNVTISGDTRFDRVAQVAAQAKDIRIAEEFSKDGFTIVAGSTWPEDEVLLAEVMKEPKIKMIIAPHEIEEHKIEFLLTLFGKHAKVCRYSQANETALKDSRVLIIDNIGMLSSLYRYGKVTYIGGGFGKGIHNTLEAAAYGRPVIFGPNYEKFNEAKELVKISGAFSITDEEELLRIIVRFINDHPGLQQASDASGQYVQKNKGATEMILGKIEIS